MVGSHCDRSLHAWEDGLARRAARVAEAWKDHEKRRASSAVGHQAAKEISVAKCSAAKKYGFLVGNVKVVSKKSN